MINIGIIGCGAIAIRRHAPACAAHPNVHISGFADATFERANELAQQFHSHAYTSIDDMLKDPSVHAVSICVPERFHEDVTIRCLNAGKHVLLEKPMAMNTAESENIVRAWQNSGKQLMIAYSQRFYPAHQIAKRLIQDGSIGRPLSFRTCQTNSGAEYVVVDPQPDFYDKRLASIGGVMSNVGCHRIDLIRFLFDTEILEIFAYTPTLDKHFSNGEFINLEDHAMLTMKLANGIVGTLWNSWCNYGNQDIGTRIYGDQGVIYIPNYETVFYYPRNGETQEFHIPQTEALIYGWDVVSSFIDSLSENHPTATNGYDGLACMHVLDAIRASNSTRAWVAVSSSQS